jgi:hypothetical protein
MKKLGIIIAVIIVIVIAFILLRKKKNVSKNNNVSSANDLDKKSPDGGKSGMILEEDPLTGESKWVVPITVGNKTGVPKGYSNGINISTKAGVQNANSMEPVKVGIKTNTMPPPPEKIIIRSYPKK